MVTPAQPAPVVSTAASATMRSRVLRVGLMSMSVRTGSAVKGEGEHRTGLHRRPDLRSVLLGGRLVEDVHDVVVVDLEELVGHRLTHADALTQVPVHGEPHRDSTRSTG